MTHNRFHQKEENGAWEMFTETSVAINLVPKMNDLGLLTTKYKNIIKFSLCIHTSDKEH